MSGFDDLKRKLDRLLKEPGNSELYNDIGVLLFQYKDFENAEKYLQKAYELDSLNEDILYNYASVLYYRLRLRKAVSVFKSYLELCPNDKEVIKKIGDSYYQLGKYAFAAKIYKLLKEA